MKPGYPFSFTWADAFVTSILVYTLTIALYAIFELLIFLIGLAFCNPYFGKRPTLVTILHYALLLPSVILSHYAYTLKLHLPVVIVALLLMISIALRSSQQSLRVNMKTTFPILISLLLFADKYVVEIWRFSERELTPSPQEAPSHHLAAIQLCLLLFVVG